MTISAKIIADSISPAGKRLITFENRGPRFIHSEFMTHRQLSRNASSSRAIPVERMIQDVIDDPAMPIYWGKNQPGMQAREENDALVRMWTNDAWFDMSREEAWLHARDLMIKAAQCYAEAGYHKQIVNRLLEPWLHINVVVTATEWDNFFALRLHPDAQPEIHELARCMKKAMDASTPRELKPGEWHLPYVTDEDTREIQEHFRQYGAAEPVYRQKQELAAMQMLSVARCASVSYKTVDGQPMTLERAQTIYDKLVKADVFHASPFEHQATPDTQSTYRRQVKTLEGQYDHWATASELNDWNKPDLHGNFVGWVQNRNLMEKAL